MDSLDKFEIKVETGSSSYDTIENRREDAIARWNISNQAAQAQLPINLEENYKDVM
jgi:hypothetical protein